jgi:hypothetical protein
VPAAVLGLSGQTIGGHSASDKGKDDRHAQATRDSGPAPRNTRGARSPHSEANPRRRPDGSRPKARSHRSITLPSVSAARSVAHSKAEAYRDVLVKTLTEEPEVRSVELLHRTQLAGYTGGKSALYALAQTLRVRRSPH